MDNLTEDAIKGRFEEKCSSFVFRYVFITCMIAGKERKEPLLQLARDINHESKLAIYKSLDKARECWGIIKKQPRVLADDEFLSEIIRQSK